MADPQKDVPTPLNHRAVMVSSTYVDLHELRQVLIKAALSAGLFPEAMEHDSALPGKDVIASSLAKVERSAGYVLLIGQRYGQQPVCAGGNPKQLSITELEFERALECECGRAMIVLVLGEDYPLPTRLVDRTADLVNKLEAFRSRAKTMDGSGTGVQRVFKVVNSEAELREAAATSLYVLARFLDEHAGPLSAKPRVVDTSLPVPPAPYAVPAYVGSHAFAGRGDELLLLDDWVTAEDQHSLLLFEAIGGSGKSMLTWHWFTQRAMVRRSDWAGRFWYSFYVVGASMADFCRRALAYITQRPASDFQKTSAVELTHELLQHLRKRPWLLVLDGLERVLVAYNRGDAATLDEEVIETTSEKLVERDPFTTANPDDDELLRQLSEAAPSKVVVSSRLTPQSLLTPGNQPIPGVRHERLRGLQPEDAVHLLQRCGVRGDPAAMWSFIKANCDGHPLVLGALAGLMAARFPADGDFGVWMVHPAGSAALELGKLPLKQKANNILREAISAVPKKGRELLSTMALLHGGTDRIVIEALNPHRPPEPRHVPESGSPEKHPRWKSLGHEQQTKLQKQYEVKHLRYLKAYSVWEASVDKRAELEALGKTLNDLQRRGLLQMGEGKERYDLHPVVRAILSSELSSVDAVRLGQRVISYFSGRPHIPYAHAQTRQDLEGGFHIVCTLLRMECFQDALDVWRSELSDATSSNLLAWNEVLVLLKPFFRDGWLQPPQGVDEDGISYLMNEIATALQGTGLREQAIRVYGAMLRLESVGRDASALRVVLSNLARVLQDDNRVDDARICGDLVLRVEEASDDEEDLFVARVSAFADAMLFGSWARAQEMSGIRRSRERSPTIYVRGQPAAAAVAARFSKRKTR